MAAGYPPDIVSGATSLWTTNSNSFWEVTACQWQKRLDPTYNTYGSGVANYNYISDFRLRRRRPAGCIRDYGKVRRPLITVAGTMDALLPIDHHARAYARKVARASMHDEEDDDDRDGKRGAYRLYEIQNGNHLETTSAVPATRADPAARPALFDLLVDQVERGKSLPPASACRAPGPFPIRRRNQDTARACLYPEKVRDQ